MVAVTSLPSMQVLERLNCPRH